jgi:hypothetical protein
MRYFSKLCFFIVVLLLVAPFTSWAQDGGLSEEEEAALQEIITAYERTQNWNTYSAQSLDDSRLALTLVEGEESYNLTDNTQRTVDSAYDVSQSAVQSQLVQTRTIRETEGRQTLSNLTVRADFDVIGVGNEVYVAGERTANPDDGQNLEFDEYTRVTSTISADMASAQVADLQSQVDVNELVALRANANLLETATAVEDLGVMSLRQYASPVQVYAVEVDPLVGIDVLNIDVDSILSNARLEIVDRDVFNDRLQEESTLIITIFLDAETGGLVGEQLVLTVDVNLSGEDGLNVQSGIQATFTLALSYESSVLYFGINGEVTIIDPSQN